MRTSKMADKIKWYLMAFKLLPWRHPKRLTRTHEISWHFKYIWSATRFHEILSIVLDVLMGTTEIISKTLWVYLCQLLPLREPCTLKPINMMPQDTLVTMSPLLRSLSAMVLTGRDRVYLILFQYYLLQFHLYLSHISLQGRFIQFYINLICSTYVFRSYFEFTNHNPYLTFMGELWGLCHMYFLFRKLTVI